MLAIIPYLLTYGLINTALVASGLRLAAYASDMHVSWFSCFIIGWIFACCRATHRLWWVEQMETARRSIIAHTK